jgi:hypothetical protein
MTLFELGNNYQWKMDLMRSNAIIVYIPVTTLNVYWRKFNDKSMLFIIT